MHLHTQGSEHHPGFGEIVERYQPRRVYFVDETFGLDRQRAYEILTLFRQRNLGARCP